MVESQNVMLCHHISFIHLTHEQIFVPCANNTLE